jgi:hypothetical protein
MMTGKIKINIIFVDNLIKQRILIKKRNKKKIYKIIGQLLKNQESRKVVLKNTNNYFKKQQNILNIKKMKI